MTDKMRDNRVRVARWLRWLLLASLCSTCPAWADAEARPANADAEAEARRCFQRGLELFQESDLDGAAVEFRRAYQLAENFRILFNLGQVAAERHDYAAALAWFGRYLKDGVGRIPEERRRSVEEEMRKLRLRVGRIDVVAAAADAEILVDDEVVGRAPLAAPITANVGRRRVAIRTKEGMSEPKLVDVPSGELVRVEFKPEPAMRPKRAAASSPPSSLPYARGKAEPDWVQTPAERPRASSATGYGVWLGWTATGLCAAGAVASGLLAYRFEGQLRNERASYPVTSDALANQQNKVRTAGWVTDGLLVGTALFGAISLTLTFRGTHDRSVSLSPGAVAWRQTF